MAKPHVGIDVAKDQLDVWVWETETGDSVPHNEAGIEALCARLEALAPDRIVVEATGGREVPLAAALQAAGLPVAVVNPRQARAFGRALGQLAKTDGLDARLLARMAAVLRPPPCGPCPTPTSGPCARSWCGAASSRLWAHRRRPAWSVRPRTCSRASGPTWSGCRPN